METKSDATAQTQDTSFLFRPYRWAAGVAMGYFLAAGSYIIVSGEIASRAAGGSPELDRLKLIEQLKGMAFVVVTATLLYLVLVTLLRQIHAAQLKLARQNSALIRAERQSTAALFARSVAHDINNVLMVLQHQADRMKASVDDPGLLERIERIGTAVNSLTELSGRLRDLGRQLPRDRATCDLREEVRRTLNLVAMHHRLAGCRIETDLRDVGRLTTYAPLIQQSLMNLLLNAAEAVDGRGTLRVSLTTDENTVTLAVDDDGPGIEPSRRHEVFEPFYTSKEEGTGLGLVSVKACAEAHDGEVHVEGSPLGGARFVMTLKRDPERHTDPTAADPPVQERVLAR